MSIWASASVWGAILGVNVLAIWCEFQMTPDTSLLQGLATASGDNKNDKPSTNGNVMESIAKDRQSRKIRIHIQYS